jgi:hypothetical protein
LRQRNIRHISGRPYHPQNQGSVEVANGIFKRRLRAVRAERGDITDWVRFLPELQDADLNTDKGEEHEELVLTSLEKRVAENNARNVAQMARGNIIAATEVYSRETIVSL